MNEAEGENYGKLENKVGSVKRETAPAQPQQIVAMQECGSCAVTFSQFFRKEKSGFLCEIFNVSVPGTF